MPKEKLSPEIHDLLNDLHDYMSNKADADHDGDDYVPNEEMKLLTRCAEALGYLQY